MDDKVFDDIEIPPSSVVKSTARDFAAALAETPEFKVFRQAAEQFQQDQTAQRSLKDYQEKQKSLRPLLMLHALSAEQRAELDSLQRAFVEQPVVQEYFKAQTEFATLCQTLGDSISEAIGLNYAAVCGVSCCG